MCVLEEGRRRFPAANEQIDERIAEVQACRIDADTVVHLQSMLSQISCDFGTPDDQD